MCMADLNDFVVFFLLKFLLLIYFYFLYNKMKILELNFFVQSKQICFRTALFCVELHVKNPASKSVLMACKSSRVYFI